ncbi:inter-alpha-trypsin inhibitor heavy chain H3-like [Oreochromis aureus]|uniref:inter-alpha-trypsin inhibitor heavy chain H3-like n=1 Tax=Oreochromis aureus TaxID=47969 RepID=UPI0019530BF6|nr:inter-alpha-trypsin inhibitor heavy chain H3-like [Oreochromis aureus]
MGRAVVQITLIGLLFALASTLPNKDDWDIYSFHINSTVTSRYATTVITSRLFLVLFRFIDGQVYDGVVKAKEQAQQQYTEAVSRGESAGLVSSVGRTLEEFKTSVTVAAHKKVTFELTYEELMKRTHGKYELQIHARPMQPVRDFKVDVHIHEEAGISFIDVKGGLSTKALANAITKTHADKQAWVYFYPTVDQQKMCDSCGDQGMNGDLVIVYDVNRDNGLGHIKKSDGYFVHHFAPSDLPRIPKNVVFVIDQSGSMHGRKIEQTRIALVHILNDLAEDDHFGLITFDDRISYWKRELVQANSKNLESAKNFARNIQDRGSTDINEAVLQGARMLNAHNREGSASILILLTDGDPTSGVTNLENIQSNVRQAIAGKFPLYCLGFGFDVNFNFLEKMSLQNNGVARRIYEDSDADLQLKGFYEEVATPLLTDVTMIYVGGTNLTQTNFSHYYNGSEIVVAGEITDNNIETFTPQVVAISSNRRIIFSNPNETVESTGTVSDDRIQRVWAYLTVKQLLDKELQLSGPEKEKVKKEAMALSLKYSFVTPLTSMVVTKPPGENTDVLHKPKEGETSQRWPSPGGQPNLAHLTPASGYSGQWVLSADYGMAYDLETADYLEPTDAPIDVTDAPLLHRFLFNSTGNQTVPLCFDFSGAIILKLFHHPSRDLSVNGELDSIANGGFSKIFIHLKTHQHVEVDAESQRVTVRDGQTVTYQTAGQDPSTVGSVTVTVYNTEIHIAAENILLVISQHEKNGQRLLWPVLRQQPSTNNTEGLLAVKPAVYEVVQQVPVTKLKIKNQETDVTSDSAIDYSTDPPVSKNCWLMSADSALQRPLADFFMAQL